jgi:hypothetical protein
MTLAYPTLIRAGAVFALIGGGLRLISSFVPWIEASPGLESFYFVIDVALLFGLMAIYLARAEKLGPLALVGFGVAAVGQAAIIGPDHVPFGIDAYAVAVQIIAGGLLLLAIDMARHRAYPLWVPGFWIAVPFVSIGVGFIDPSPYGWGYLLGGILFSLGFAGAGSVLLREAGLSRR